MHWTKEIVLMIFLFYGLKRNSNGYFHAEKLRKKRESYAFSIIKCRIFILSGNIKW